MAVVKEITGIELRELMLAHDDKALAIWRKALGEWDGVYATCEALGVSKSTAYRVAKGWRDLRKLLSAGIVPVAERVARAGLQAQKNERKDPSIRSRRVRAIKRAARERAAR